MSNYHTWLQSFIGSVILLLNSVQTCNKNDIWLALVLLTVTQIQVIESIIWAYYESKNYAKANEMVKYIVPLLWLQPLVSFIAGYVVTKNKMLLNLSYLYMVLMIYDTYHAFNGDVFSTELGKNNHLVWKRNGKEQIIFNDTFGILYFVGLFIPFLFMEDKNMRIIIITLIALTYIILKYKYDDELNSVWCQSAGSFSTIILLSRLAIENKLLSF
jgi:hypothetical protein